MDLKTRIDDKEIMDTETLPLPVMKQTLNFLKRTNLSFGGVRVITGYLKQWSIRWPHDRPIEILDVGTGGGEIPVAIAEWARENDRRIKITGIDLVPEIVQIARENTRTYREISILQADVFEWGEQGRNFDYVIASLFLHHVLTPDLPKVLRTFDSVSRRGIIISDLLRSKPSYWSIGLLCELIGNDVVRHDGPLSVRRAFTVDELARLAREVQLPYLTARPEAWFRLSLAGEKI